MTTDTDSIRDDPPPPGWRPAPPPGSSRHRWRPDAKVLLGLTAAAAVGLAVWLISTGMGIHLPKMHRPSLTHILGAVAAIATILFGVVLVLGVFRQIPYYFMAERRRKKQISTRNGDPDPPTLKRELVRRAMWAGWGFIISFALALVCLRPQIAWRAFEPLARVIHGGPLESSTPPVVSTTEEPAPETPPAPQSQAAPASPIATPALPIPPPVPNPKLEVLKRQSAILDVEIEQRKSEQAETLRLQAEVARKQAELDRLNQLPAAPLRVALPPTPTPKPIERRVETSSEIPATTFYVEPFLLPPALLREFERYSPHRIKRDGRIVMAVTPSLPEKLRAELASFRTD